MTLGDEDVDGSNRQGGNTEKRRSSARETTPRLDELIQHGTAREGKIVMTPESKTEPLAVPSLRAMTAGSWTILIVLLLLFAASLVIAVMGWSLGSGTAVPASGYLALALGVVFSLAVGLGLMGLVFYSSRKGYDEPPVLLPVTAPLSAVASTATKKTSTAKERE
ncbi:hypothetical protein [Bradyrhizobium embrapense]